MAEKRIKIVVWDSIGNTLLGVRPWESWEAGVQEHLLWEDAAGSERVRSFRQFFAGHDVDLVWFNSADTPYAPFGQLYADYEGSLRFTRDVEKIGREIADADYLVLHKETLPPQYIRQSRNLKLIQHLGQDARGVPLQAAREMGIPVAATPLINYITVAEQVWAYILNWSKRLPAVRDHMQAREYAETWGRFPGLTYLGDLTLGLVGMGEIARPIARAAQAFDMPVIYWNRQRLPEFEEKYGMEYVDWKSVFRRSDVLSLQIAINPETVGIIGDQEIGWMKQGALFINTARGKLVDQPALTKAVQSGRIAVALDVFADEPLPYDDPLLALHDNADERITLTPHNAWQSPWTWVRDSQELWFNVLRSIDGEPLKHLI